LSEPNLRRLSNGSAGGERPLRAQLVIALVLGLILFAVPLYLFRRPSGTATHVATDGGAQRFGGVVRATVDASTGSGGVMLGRAQRVRCGASASQTSGEGGLCDALPALEAAFRTAIRGNDECAPRTGSEGSINYVLEVDFASNRLNVFPGKSGKWRGPRAQRAATCVLRSFPPVAWGEITHQHQYYAIAILATYPPVDLLDVLPTFE
jgi:hypothetical protein